MLTIIPSSVIKEKECRRCKRPKKKDDDRGGKDRPGSTSGLYRKEERKVLCAQIFEEWGERRWIFP